MITFINLFLKKSWVATFKVGCLGQIRPNLAQILPNLVHLKTGKGQHYVGGTSEVLLTLKNILRLKI